MYVVLISDFDNDNTISELLTFLVCVLFGVVPFAFGVELSENARAATNLVPLDEPNSITSRRKCRRVQ